MRNKSKTELNSQYLLIKLQSIEFSSSQQSKDFQFVYYSFAIDERMYFTSMIDSQDSTLTDDIVLPLQTNQIPQILKLYRWQNHMIMFYHEIDVSELRSRATTKKKQETKSGQILTFLIFYLTDNELRFGNKYVKQISQHYFIIQDMQIKNRSKERGSTGPSYFLIKTSGPEYIMPVSEGDICIKLPETMTFEHIKNGKVIARSKQYQPSELAGNQIQVQLQTVNGNNYSISMTGKWGINFFQTKTQNSLLIEAHEIYIYDVQVRFDSYNEYANSRVKFVYGNKGFEIGSQFNTAKPHRIKKIIYFIIKSEDQEITILVQRNLKVVAQSKFYTDQISPYTVHCPKRKFLDDNGKIVGSVKFKCQKAKNLSTPTNNKFWKQCNKKKVQNTILMSISQMSVNYQNNQNLSVLIKSESEEKLFTNVPNFKYFDENAQISFNPNVLLAKPDQNIYVILKNEESSTQNQNDFIGIATLNFGDFRLGSNSTYITFYKNQLITASANCIINKVAPYPFVKAIFQPQILHAGPHKTMSLTLFMKKVTFTPYYYTYRYDNKNEVYCIVEVNRLKKVLIMESAVHNELNFLPSTSSDTLNFYIEDAQYLKVKITFLVSDVGYEQEIYGSSIIKLKTGELNSAVDGLKYQKIDIKNQFGTVVGSLNVQIHEGITTNKYKKAKNIGPETGPFKSEIKRVQNDLHQINKNMEIMEESLKKKNKKSLKKSPIQVQKNYQSPSPPYNRYLKKNTSRYDNSIDYSNKRRQRNYSVALPSNQLKLPNIKQKKKNNLQDLVNMMKIRKRDPRGYYEQNSKIKAFKPQYPVSQFAENNSILKNHEQPFKTDDGSNNNFGGSKSLELKKADQKMHKMQSPNQAEKKGWTEQDNFPRKGNEIRLIDNVHEIDIERDLDQNHLSEFDDNQFFRPSN